MIGSKGCDVVNNKNKKEFVLSDIVDVLRRIGGSGQEGITYEDLNDDKLFCKKDLDRTLTYFLIIEIIMFDNDNKRFYDMQEWLKKDGMS